MIKSNALPNIRLGLPSLTPSGSLDCLHQAHDFPRVDIYQCLSHRLLDCLHALGPRTTEALQFSV
jgi:hypothetical protein